MEIDTSSSGLRENCLTDLKPLQITDLSAFKSAITAGQQQGWAYYFPFLLFVRYGAENSQMLWTEDEGSLCLFVRQTGKKNRLHLYFPPFPANDAALQRCLERANEYNREHSTWIYWIDEDNADQLHRLKSLRLQRRNPQYLYRPRDLADMSGSTYRTLRRNISLGRRMTDIDIQPYHLEDAPECRQLLEHWGKTQGQGLTGTFYQRRYALNCFQLAPQFQEQDLRGLVFRVNGQVRAFAFGGEIRPELGCSLLTIAAPDVTCLSYVVRHHFLSGMTNCLVVNDGSDGGQDGLREMKVRFRPCGLHNTFKAKQVGRLPVKISTVEHQPHQGFVAETYMPLPPYVPTQEDVAFLNVLTKALRAASPSDVNKAAIDRQFARTSFPQAYHRLILMLYAEGYKRILISRSAREATLRFSSVFYRLLKHSRCAKMAATPFRLQMDFVIAPAVPVNYEVLGNREAEDTRFAPGLDGLLIYGPDDTLRIVSPGDAYITAINETADLKLYLNQVYGETYLQNSRILRFRARSYLSDSSNTWLDVTHSHPLAGQSERFRINRKTARKQSKDVSSKPYPPARYELRPSRIVPGHVGLFALFRIEAGDVVVPDSFFDQTRLIPWSEMATIDPVTRGKLIQYCHKSSKGVYAPQNINHISIGYFINHSCDPSMAVNTKGDYVALRAISANEELTADLEKSMKKTCSEFVCSCQAPDCRKIIRI